MKLFDWVIQHWLIARWVVFAIVVGSVWIALTTVLADDPSSGTVVASDGWISLCCGLGFGSFVIPLWGVNRREGRLSRSLGILVILVLMTVSLTFGIETTEGALEDAGFWFAMFAVCTIALGFIASPVNSLGFMMQAASRAEDER